MKSKIIIIIRILLSIALLYGIYKETGICTIISMVLSLLAFEMILCMFRLAAKQFDDHHESITEIVNKVNEIDEEINNKKTNKEEPHD
jgi:hypothetical protein